MKKMLTKLTVSTTTIAILTQSSGAETALVSLDEMQ